jgi:DNA-binding transcriptional LysR family regulator
MLNWNDLRYFLAVARDGSTLAAAKSLGVNQSTVQRRLAALESALGRPLVVRRPTGYELTDFGEHFVPYARSVEDAVLSARVAATGFGAMPAGRVALTCPEPVLERLAASGVFARFAARFPALALDLKTADQYLDLWHGEADVALRSGEPEDRRLVGRRIADSHWAFYASRTYLKNHERPVAVADLAQHPLIAFDGLMQQHRVNVWLSTAVPAAHIVARNASVLGVLAAVKSGIGIGALPTTIADREDTLEQVLAAPELTRGWYLLTRPDLRTEPRVAAVFDFLIGELTAVRASLMGEAPAGP